MSDTLFRAALELAMNAATIPCRDTALCKKSRRGATIWKDSPFIATSGTNFRADNKSCDMSNQCMRDCPRICVHAEQSALLEWSARSYGSCDGAEALHVKTVGAVLVPSGTPSCIECSKLMSAFGIKCVWLFHEDGWKRYSIEDFHMKTLRNARLYSR